MAKIDSHSNFYQIINIYWNEYQAISNQLPTLSLSLALGSIDIQNDMRQPSGFEGERSITQVTDRSKTVTQESATAQT